ncbi:MAG TPA: prenyltransferase/squalene oxidase repeat-containing protein [Pirellulales bacterium]|nr:prenyltransferase/squalene oxidase repeat-containing protein [Pirellulales bacterium]
MRMFLLIVAVGLPCASALATEPAAPVQGEDVNAAIDRGLAFLARDAVAWRDEHKCVSCHHASLIVCAMREAKLDGRAVDEPLLAELTKWIAESGDGKTGVPRPDAVPRAFNEKAVSLALALAADPKPDDLSREGARRLLATVKEDQIENGGWASWPETRPPMFGNSDERATLSATLALLPAAKAGDDSAKQARDKAVTWLEGTPADGDAQSLALRVVLWTRLDRPASEYQPWVETIKQRQNADGGWSQTPELASDAWATGQALYALAHAGLTSADAIVARGQRFLVAAQREDGSWPMVSRPTKPGGEGSTSLIPITGAGSAWGVLGLVRSAGPVRAP